MKVRKPGHIYELATLDGDGKPIVVTFVCREEYLGIASGTQTQEVLRMITDLLEHDMKVITEMQEMLIDRTNHCDNCERWEGNDRVIKAMSESARQARLALVFHEQRALERHFGKGFFDPVKVPTGPDGHFKLEGSLYAEIETARKQRDTRWFAPLIEGSKERRVGKERRKHAPDVARMIWAHHEQRSGGDRRVYDGKAETEKANRRKGNDRRCATYYANAPTEAGVKALLAAEAERRKALGTPERRKAERRTGQATFHPNHGWNRLGKLKL